MEVLKDCSSQLSNYEVMMILKNLKHAASDEEKSFLKKLSGKKKLYYSDKGVQNLNTIVYETLEYLEQTPCAQQTSESLKNFLNAVKPFDLTRAEKLQFINLRPTSSVELQLLVEEGDERISIEQEQEILEIVKLTLPKGPDEEAIEEEEAVDKMVVNEEL